MAAPPWMFALAQQMRAEPGYTWWLDHAAAVESRARRAELSLNAARETLFKLANEWAEKMTADGAELHPELYGTDEIRYVLQDIRKTYGDRLKRNYPLLSNNVVAYDLMREWVKSLEQSTVGMVSYWTNAPKDYDQGRTRRTGQTVDGQSGVFEQVLIPVAQVPYQLGRYDSGLKATYDDEGIAKEREYGEKAKRRKVWAAETARLSAEVRRAADLIPATRADGYWTSGVRYESTYDEKTGRSYPRPAQLPPSDPIEAVRILRKVGQAFRALPEEARKEEWRIGADTDDLMRLALRWGKRVKGEARQKQAKAQEELSGRAYAMQETRARFDAAGMPGNLANMVVVRYVPMPRGNSVNYGIDKAYGRLLRYPAQGETTLETELGRVEVPLPEHDSITGKRTIERTYFSAVPGPGVPVPIAVWQAGAIPPLGVVTLKETAYAYKPQVEYRNGAPYETYKPDVIVLRADGRKVPKGSALYEAGERAQSGRYVAPEKSQDQVLDELAHAVQTAGLPADTDGSWYTQTYQGVPVQFLPTRGKSLSGWNARSRQIRTVNGRPRVGWLWFTRFAKPQNKVLWHLDVRYPDGFLVDEEAERVLRSWPVAIAREAREWLAVDPRRSIVDMVHAKQAGKFGDAQLAILRGLQPGDSVWAADEEDASRGAWYKVTNRRGSDVYAEHGNGAAVQFIADDTDPGTVALRSASGVRGVVLKKA